MAAAELAEAGSVGGLSKCLAQLSCGKPRGSGFDPICRILNTKLCERQ